MNITKPAHYIYSKNLNIRKIKLLENGHATTNEHEGHTEKIKIIELGE